MWRSPRRGAVLETTNQNVDEKVIELINWWRRKEGSDQGVRGRAPNETGSHSSEEHPAHHEALLSGFVMVPEVEFSPGGQ